MSLAVSLLEQAPAETYMRFQEIPFRLAHHPPTNTAIAEAMALDRPADDVLKTVMLKVGDEYRLAIVPASRRLDIRLIRRLVDEPVRLATETELQRDFSDYELGAIPPLPGFLRLRAFVDESVFEHDVVAFADGRTTESIIANPHVLFWRQEVYVADITSGPQSDEAWRFEGDAIAVDDKDFFA